MNKELRTAPRTTRTPAVLTGESYLSLFWKGTITALQIRAPRSPVAAESSNRLDPVYAPGEPTGTFRLGASAPASVRPTHVLPSSISV